MEQGKSKPPLLRRFAANTGWLVAQNVFQYMLSAVVGILAARYLGPENYGVLGYGVSLMALFTPLCTLGIDSIQIPAMIESPEKTGEIIGTATALRGASSVLSILGITAIATLTKPGDTVLIVVTALQSLQLLFQMFDSFRLWFQKELMSKYTAIGSVVGNIACSVWRIALLARGASVEWFALTSVVQMMTNYLVVLPLFARKARLRLSFSWQTGKRLLGSGYHFILSGLTVAVSNYSGRLLLSYLLGETMLGYYNAATTVAMMWIFVPQAVVDSATPVLLEIKRGDPDAFLPRFQAVHLLLFLVGTAAGLGLTVLAPWIIDFLYGVKYAPAAGVLRIVAWIGLLSSIGIARGIWVLAEHKEKYVKYYCLIAAVTSIVANYAGIRLWGLAGAAVACVLTGLVQALIAPCLFRGSRQFTLDYFGSFGRIGVLTDLLKDWAKRGKGNDG